MPKITYITSDAKVHEIDVENGLTVMEGAVQNDIPGIDADCGGGMACATCHVYVTEDWFDKLPKKSVKVAESGIRKSDHLKFIGDIGYDAALVGTSLMKTGNPGKALEKLKRGSL